MKLAVFLEGKINVQITIPDGMASRAGRLILDGIGFGHGTLRITDVSGTTLGQVDWKNPEPKEPAAPVKQPNVFEANKS